MQFLSVGFFSLVPFCFSLGWGGGRVCCCSELSLFFFYYYFFGRLLPEQLGFCSSCSSFRSLAWCVPLSPSPGAQLLLLGEPRAQPRLRARTLCLSRPVWVAAPTQPCSPHRGPQARGAAGFRPQQEGCSAPLLPSLPGKISAVGLRSLLSPLSHRPFLAV